MAKANNTRDFYVYLHRRATDGKVFYVGKGHGNRISEKRRSKHWNNVFKKHGLITQYYATGLQEWYAFELEKELIAYYGRENLCNMTDGGEGATGAVRGEITRKKIGDFHRGRKRSDATLVNMSLAKRNPSLETRMKMSAAKKGKKLSDEHIKNRTKSQLGKNNPSAKSVLCVETNHLFHTMTDAENWLKSIGFLKASKSAICNCARGKIKSAYGYKWTYGK